MFMDRSDKAPNLAVTAVAALLLAFGVAPAGAQTTGAGEQREGEPAGQALSEAELEQLVAPIALHPDSLLSQILMASTYPLEVVEAARWVEQNPDVSGDALEQAMAKESWDASVKSLAAFPEVLQMMNDDLGWTQRLGDAFLAQQEAVLDAVQKLRARADAEGTLTSSKEQKVEKKTVTAESGQPESVYVIEPANPDVVYVPSYNPTVVYGGWPYPSYPPHTWYPPGYVAGGALWFASGVAVGSALWGGCDWGGGYVNININRYNRFNRTNISSSRWSHNVAHRRGVNYTNRNVAQRYGRDVRNVQARERYRGRAEAGRRDIAAKRPAQRPAARPRPGQRPKAGQRPGASQRPGAAKRPSAGQRPAAGKRPAARPAARKQPAAYRGVGQGNQVRRQSARGHSSRQAMKSRSRSRPSGGRRGGRGRR